MPQSCRSQKQSAPARTLAPVEAPFTQGPPAPSHWHWVQASRAAPASRPTELPGRAPRCEAPGLADQSVDAQGRPMIRQSE